MRMAEELTLQVCCQIPDRVMPQVTLACSGLMLAWYWQGFSQPAAGHLEFAAPAAAVILAIMILALK